MECLGLPVDHRLRGLIRARQPVENAKGVGSHVEILHEFGMQLRSRGHQWIDVCALNFAIELARPETKGGVVVVLDQPANTQQYDRGYIGEMDECRTLAAVRSLISLASNGDVDSVSVFDSLPLIPKRRETKELRKEAHEVFVRMIAAKEPDVVISCFRVDSHHDFIRGISCFGVGRTFPNPTVRNGKSSFRKVNAFHPSTAVNYNRSYSCLRRLLILEFVMAFSPPTEEYVTSSKWIKILRGDCTYVAPRLERDTKVRWKEITDLLSRLLKQNDFFREYASDTTDHVRELVASSNITWACCDVGLFLDAMTGQADNELRTLVGKSILEMFKSYCSLMWPAGLKYNLERTRGYFDHHKIMLLKSDLELPLARRLHDASLAFLRDLNLTFVYLGDAVGEAPLRAQKNAFLRFAKAIEDNLEGAMRSKSLEPLKGESERVIIREAIKDLPSKSNSTLIVTKEVVDDLNSRFVEKLRI